MGCVPRTNTQRKIIVVRNRNISVQTKKKQRIMCAGEEKEEKHGQEAVNAHGEDSSENRLVIMGRLKVPTKSLQVAVVFDEWREIYFT